MTTRIGVVVFPGTNCEHDVVKALSLLADDAGGPKVDAELVWHGSTTLEGLDAVVLPGGFAHGDYLRPGALARFSPVMDAVHALCGRRRSGCRDLQRLSGADRSRPSARRPAEEQRVALLVHHRHAARWSPLAAW